MFDMSWSELLLIAVVALIVIGPKDLPKAVKVLAQFARKARTLAREFQSGFEEMAREAELHEVRRELESTASADYAHEIEHAIDPGGHVARSLEHPPEDATGAAGVASERLSTSAPDGAAVAAGELPRAASIPDALAKDAALETIGAAKASAEPSDAEAAGAALPPAKP